MEWGYKKTVRKLFRTVLICCLAVRLISSTAVAAIATTTIAAAVTTATVATAVTAGRSVCLGLCDIDPDGLAFEVGAVERVDRSLSFGLVRHLHEAEATRAARFAVGDYVSRGYLAVL